MSNQTQTDSIATIRDEYPSGLRVLMQNESVGYMIDALMDMPGTQFSKSLLAEKAGVSRQSAHTHYAACQPWNRDRSRRLNPNADAAKS